ncbi:Hsp20/alpha crystallin family protein [Bradyrhizobium sp.]|uniref:Hsp20/alpha crystallin family protein n=1 Tax=Bradyrhizobium sp. TaxID=376 RepID=UPI002384E2D6|nr:Hsp20/alpha crystallin family protein [Bradyrhizobium sp.]MDE2375810.1 Hsp20/alpha crystallin family protein [Bradyrhizobium sp.]
MANETKLPVTKQASPPAFAPEAWHPFESLRKEVDRLFEDFGRGDFWGRSFPTLAGFEKNLTRKFAAAPAVDVVENDKAYEITAELPGMEEKDIEVKLANGGLTIKGEKKEEKEEKQKDYYVSERRYGSFERYFALPDGIDADKIGASFKNGVLKVTLPKTAEAQKPAKTIEVKAS